MDREQPPHLEEDREGFSLNYMPACWRAEIEAARAGKPEARPAPREPFSFDACWDYAAYLVTCIGALFGLPAVLASQFMMMRKERRDLLAWLAPAEALARRLLLLKALEAPIPNGPPARQPRAGRLVSVFADECVWAPDEDAAKWNVRFAVMPRGAFVSPRRAAQSEDRPERLHSNSVPLARRIEALRRVLENPGPAIARLARLLALRRPLVSAAFGAYRHKSVCARFFLEDAQRALDLALNTS